MSEANNLTNQYLKHKKSYQRKQLAQKSLNNYLEQLRIHYDLTEGDLNKILKLTLSTKTRGNFFKKVWNMFK